MIKKFSYPIREQAVLQFCGRVLAQANRPKVPLLEKLRYLCIVSSNLDEFFEVRMADLVDKLTIVNGRPVEDDLAFEHFSLVSAEASRLVEEQYRLYNDIVMPALAKKGVMIVSHAQRTPAQRAWVADFFEQEVKPLLVPVVLDPSHPFPVVANKSLNYIVQLADKDAFGRSHGINIVKVPRSLPRVIKLPQHSNSKKQAYILLTSVLRTHLSDLFDGRKIEGYSQFRLTRDSDLAVDELEVKNLRQALRSGLSHRHYGNPVRLEITQDCPEHLAEFLRKQFSLLPEMVYRVRGQVNLGRLNALIDLSDAPALKFPVFEPVWSHKLPIQNSILATLKHQDVLLHHPYEQFDAVVELLREAVYDPDVLAIKQTIYRTGNDSELMELLVEATHQGKEVMVVVELKARFDEEANINWAERLEAVGVQVVYGVVGLKTHAKMLLITRREKLKGDTEKRKKGQSLLKRYAHLSTGNYNSKTAKLYTDFGMMTSNNDITADIENVFRHLAGMGKVQPLKHLWLAPFDLHKNIVAQLERLELAAKNGQKVSFTAKMNAFTDQALMHALIKAGRAGVKIDLIVRGACLLIAGIEGDTDNITVRSIVGRFLEHPRIMCFSVDHDVSLYLSSADWMGRNMFQRVEVAWPVLDDKLRQRIIDEALTPCLQSSADSWQQQPDGSYINNGFEIAGPQQLLMNMYSKK